MEYTEEVLDEMVHEAKAGEAADINNGGRDAQIAFLRGIGVIPKPITVKVEDKEENEYGSDIFDPDQYMFIVADIPQKNVVAEIRIKFDDECIVVDICGEDQIDWVATACAAYEDLTTEEEEDQRGWPRKREYKDLTAEGNDE